MPTIKALLRTLAHQLSAQSETSQLDAELLLMHVLKQSRAFLYAHNDEVLTSNMTAQLELLLAKRLLGTPMAYLLGEREFWSLLFYVSADTLIPRPETELLVELTLKLLGHRKTCSVLELGTGTGAISIALATEKPNWHFLATDQSEQALLIAEKNRCRHGVKNIKWLDSNWFEKIDLQLFDLIISNPPYLAEDDIHQYQGDLRFEPKTALLSGINGLDDLNHIIQKSPEYLAPGGLLLLEHGYDQAKAVKHNLDLSAYQKITIWQDNNQVDRVTSAWKAI